MTSPLSAGRSDLQGAGLYYCNNIALSDIKYITPFKSLLIQRKETSMQNMQNGCHSCCKPTFIGRLGYAYVPMQQEIGKVYSPQKALCAGTIFPELNITIGEYERGLFDGR